jgi:hypothetical protein
LPPALIIEQPKPPPKHTFLVPSNPTAVAALAAQKQLQQPHGSLPPGGGATKVAFNMDSSNKAKTSLKGNSSLIPPSGSNSSTTSGAAASSKSTKLQQAQQQQKEQAEKTTASPGDPNTSTLRKLRKMKKTIASEPAVDLPEFDPNGKRTCTKKEYSFRIFQLLRYRDLRQGDYCAARLTSRDLWILAKVLKDYKSTSMHNLKSIEFLQLSDVRRDALFKEKVLLKDVEEKEDAASTLVARNLVLPLPRSCAEASEWATRLKKNSRVYAMYPNTTSLYPATVIDSTTYCRGDDDIIVVEFDEEDPNITTGKVPTYHIPARFVTLIPRELPASQPASKSTGAHTGKQTGKRKRSSTNSTAGSSAGGGSGGYLDMISMDFANSGGDSGLGFDALDLDFDKPLDDEDQQEDFPPF